MSTATAFVGKQLSEEQYGDDSLRRQTLQDAAQAIQSAAPGINILNQNELFCSMTISGSRQMIAAVAQYLEESGVGHLDSGGERPALKGALAAGFNPA